jgi:hypothetical protein
MNTQLWVAYSIPEYLPDFVNPHITKDYFEFRTIYIFEIDVSHEIFSRCKTPDNKCKTHLKYHGFLKPTKIYQGLESEIFLTGNPYPPKLSSLLVRMYE